MSSDAKEHVEKIRQACIDNAEAFLSIAEREIKNVNTSHICFHLALLALEELGKLTLSVVTYTTSSAGKEKPNLIDASDDHKKKIFWAIWGGGLMRNNTLTKETIEQNIQLADTLHGRRLETLYTDQRNPVPVDQRIEASEAEMIIKYTRAKLELEKTNEIIDFEDEDKDLLAWYFNAVEDDEMKTHIFGGVSITKYKELGDSKKWMQWLRETFEKHQKEMQELAKAEIERKEPQGEERDKPKYLMRVRIQSPSHSIRGNAFTKWNEQIDHIKLHKSDRKDATKLTKGEILIDLTFPKALPAHGVWEHGLYNSKTVVLSLSVATLGVFWWHVPKDIEKYYEYVKDIDIDPKGGTGITVAPQKRLQVNFDEAKMVLDENAMRNVNHILALFFREREMLKECLSSYAMGLACFSKTDIHLRIEVNAFAEFYQAFKQAMIAFGDWDGKASFKEAVLKQFERIGEMKDLETVLDIGEQVVADTEHKKHHKVTLTEVIAMKIYCDYYLQLKARDYFQKLDESEKK